MNPSLGEFAPAMPQPNPVGVAWSIVKALSTTSRPNRFGSGTADHRALRTVLDALAHGGVPAAARDEGALDAYLAAMEEIDPEELTRSHALAYWLNVYNAGAVRLALEAHRRGAESVLRVPGGFRRPAVLVSGEHLSLDAIEHGKIRRFGDPRIHAALVCGSVSCPTLRPEPYEGSGLDDQLDDQMREFLTRGAASIDRDSGALLLSRVFLWYGGDFVRPRRMPTWIPPGRSALLDALRPWLSDATRTWIDEAGPGVRFQSYDWGLRCAVG